MHNFDLAVLSKKWHCRSRSRARVTKKLVSQYSRWLTYRLDNECSSERGLRFCTKVDIAHVYGLVIVDLRDFALAEVFLTLEIETQSGSKCSVRGVRRLIYAQRRDSISILAGFVLVRFCKLRERIFSYRALQQFTNFANVRMLDVLNLVQCSEQRGRVNAY